MRRLPALFHYTKDPDFTVDKRTYGESENSYRFGKPDGLWVSVDDNPDYDGWYDWRRKGRFPSAGLDREHRYQIHLRPERILVIRTEMAMDMFARRFMQRERSKFGVLNGDPKIRWKLVENSFSGIIIPNWMNKDRNFWYSAWDCASGCIWDTSAIVAVTRAPNLERVEEAA